MHIELNGDGNVRFTSPQKQWNGDGSFQTALFAGERMTAMEDDREKFRLHYLGFKSAGFETLADAKIAAPDFAKAVLEHMVSSI